MTSWICIPFSNIFAPTQGAGRLYSYVKKNNDQITFHDFNQHAFFSLFKKEYIGNCIELLSYTFFTTGRTEYLRQEIGEIIIKSSIGFITDLVNNGSINFAQRSKKKISPSKVLLEIINNKDLIVKRISQASELLDDKMFVVDESKFLKNFALLLCGKAIYDAVYFPICIDFGLGVYSAQYGANVADILSFVNNNKLNFLYPYFNNHIIPLINTEQPEVVGISVTHSSELYPAFSLSKTIKTAAPQTHICLGGATITEIATIIKKNECLWNYFDSIVIGPGEESFSHLLHQIKNKKSLEKVPNLIYKVKNKIKMSPIHSEFNLNNACTAEYPFLRKNNPLSLETSSGCYWGKCIFCNYPLSGINKISSTYPILKERNIELVINDIITLKNKYNPNFIGITDSTLHPDRLLSILEANQRYRLKLKFTAFIRFEKNFLSKSFCHKISKLGFLGGQAGLESGSQRVNNLIKKGIRLSDVEEILKNFYKEKILIHVYSIIGIPGEHNKDTEKTYLFFKKMHKFITLGWQIYPFTLMNGTTVSKNISDYHLFPVESPSENLSRYVSFQNKQGFSQIEALLLSVKLFDKLKKYSHPITQLMDVESFKLYIFNNKAKLLNSKVNQKSL